MPISQSRQRTSLFMTQLVLMIVVNLHTTVQWLTNMLTDRPLTLASYLTPLVFIAFWGWLHYEVYAFWQRRDYQRVWVSVGLGGFGCVWAALAVGALLLHDPVEALLLGSEAVTALALAISHCRIGMRTS